jgi:hypothetical protein
VFQYTPAQPPGSAEPINFGDSARISAAAFRAIRLYPGPVGRLISQELLSWKEFGKRLSNDSLIMQVVTEIMDTPLPT